MKSALRCSAGVARSRILARAGSTFLVPVALSLLAVLVLVPSADAASGDLAWQRVYDSPGSGYDDFRSTAPAPNHGVYVAGYNSTTAGGADFIVARYSAAGQRLWARIYDGPGLNGLAVSESAADSRHNLVLVGTANLATMAVVKYGPGGGRAWVRFYDDPASSNENATHVAVDAAGNIYVTGDTMPGGADEDVILLKYSPAGVLRWVRHYSPAGLNQDSPRDIDVDAAGNVYVTARGSVSANGSDILTLKYDPAGHRRWAKRWDGPGAGNDYPEAMAVTGIGSVFVAGSATGVSSDYDAVVLKYGPTGALLWSRLRTSPGMFRDYYAGIVLLGNGDVAAAGGTYGVGEPYDVLLARISPSGRTRWARAYDGGGNETGERIARGPADDIYVAGESQAISTSLDVLTLRFSGAGNRRWARAYYGAGGHDLQYPMALTVNGGVFVAGYQNDGGASDGFILKYKP